MSARPVGRCIGCFHPFSTGPCGGCGAVEQCDGWCHDEGTGDCTRCESGDWQQMCDDCNAYAAQDA
jgi:hypothetical protein